MALFRKKHLDQTPDVSEEPDEAPAPATPDASARADAAPPQSQDGEEDSFARTRGPFDQAEVDGPGDRIDVGALWLPGDRAIRLEGADGVVVPIAAAIEEDGLVMRVQAFAAPKSAGIWDEIREELAEQARTTGGEVSDIPGPFGRELLVTLPPQAGQGPQKNNIRFWGVDGPRWFLRGVLSGPKVLDEEMAGRCADAFADIVVVRGPEARAPRELLELHVPEAPSAQTRDEVSFDPMHRGPEITEVR